MNIQKARYILSRLWDRYYEMRYCIRAGSGCVSYTDPEYMEHSPIPFRHFFTAIRRVDVCPEDVFFDYGCGSGRALVGAASWPFLRVEGVDLNLELTEAARANLRRARGLRCHNWRLTCADAGEFQLPDDVNVAYFYNPFRGSVLDRVVQRLRESLDRNPRHMTVIYFNRDDWSRATQELPWVQPREEFGFDYPRTDCGIYDCRP